jgi:hypothetical protein
VDIHQAGADLLEQPHVDRTPIDAGNAAPFAAHFAGEGDIIWVVEQVLAREDLADGSPPHRILNTPPPGAVCVGADDRGSARPPSSISTASMMMDLPAPVSPVKMISPDSNPSSSLSMMAKFSMRSSVSMG